MKLSVLLQATMGACASVLLLPLVVAMSATPAWSAEAQAEAVAASPAQKAAKKPDPAQGEARYTAVCAACHGADGNSSVPAQPKLAAQHPEYIVKQLQEFKSGTRKSPIMQPFAAALSEDDMRNIAAWVAAKAPKPGFAKDKALVAIGEKIFRGGIAERQVPACASCHSPNGAGLPAQYPRLAGQHADYTAAQLTAFRDGARANNAVMTGVSAKLNDREIKALGDYIAGLR